MRHREKQALFSCGAETQTREIQCVQATLPSLSVEKEGSQMPYCQLCSVPAGPGPAHMLLTDVAVAVQFPQETQNQNHKHRENALHIVIT